MKTEVYFRPLVQADWKQVASIYQAGIATGQATFELKVPTWGTWNRKHHSHSRIVALIENQIVAFAALSPVSSREVYSGVAEESVYVSPPLSGQGIGTQILTRLISESEAQGIWTLQASIFRENPGSLHIHRKLGFRQIGFRERIAQHLGIWRDTLIMERRSPKIN